MTFRAAIAIAVSIISCFAVTGAFALFGSFEGSRQWYESLSRPSFTPPNWLFAPAWTVLYIMMGIAAGLVWLKGTGPWVTMALAAFAFQLLLNALWTPLFFGMRSPSLALVDIVLLWLAIIATIVIFWRISRPASLLLIPYILWVSFALLLNLRIWQLNR
jgi:translocator protein